MLMLPQAGTKVCEAPGLQLAGSHGAVLPPARPRATRKAKVS